MSWQNSKCVCFLCKRQLEVWNYKCANANMYIYVQCPIYICANANNKASISNSCCIFQICMSQSSWQHSNLPAPIIKNCKLHKHNWKIWNISLQVCVFAGGKILFASLSKYMKSRSRVYVITVWESDASICAGQHALSLLCQDAARTNLNRFNLSLQCLCTPGQDLFFGNRWLRFSTWHDIHVFAAGWLTSFGCANRDWLSVAWAAWLLWRDSLRFLLRCVSHARHYVVYWLRDHAYCPCMQSLCNQSPGFGICCRSCCKTSDTGCLAVVSHAG